MAEIVNLRQARKRAARKTAETQAEYNRALSSVSGKAKRLQRESSESENRKLDGHKREPNKP